MFTNLVIGLPDVGGEHMHYDYDLSTHIPEKTVHYCSEIQAMGTWWQMAIGAFNDILQGTMESIALQAAVDGQVCSLDSDNNAPLSCSLVCLTEPAHI